MYRHAALLLLDSLGQATNNLLLLHNFCQQYGSWPQLTDIRCVHPAAAAVTCCLVVHFLLAGADSVDDRRIRGGNPYRARVYEAPVLAPEAVAGTQTGAAKDAQSSSVSRDESQYNPAVRFPGLGG
jgi:hypothetical protein